MANYSDAFKPVVDALCSDGAGIASVVMGILLAISEVMALTNRTRSNGLLHALVIAIRKGDCVPKTPRPPVAQQPVVSADTLRELTLPRRSPVRPFHQEHVTHFSEGEPNDIYQGDHDQRQLQ